MYSLRDIIRYGMLLFVYFNHLYIYLFIIQAPLVVLQLIYLTIPDIHYIQYSGLIIGGRVCPLIQYIVHTFSIQYDRKDLKYVYDDVIKS